MSAPLAKAAEGVSASAVDSGTSGSAGAAASTNQTPATPPSAEPLVIESKVSTGPTNAEVNPIKRRPAEEAPKPRDIILPAPADTRGLLSLQKSSAMSSGASQVQAPAPAAPLKIGFGRSVDATESVPATAALLDWSPSPRGGEVAALRFTSSGARGVRVGLRVQSVPIGGTVRFYGSDAGEIFEIPAQEIVKIIQRNLDAGDNSDAAHTYWSPNLGGEAITVEFDVPPGVSPQGWQVSVPSLSHVVVDARDAESLKALGDAGSCNLDVNCNATYSSLSNAVAMMDFIVGTNTYLCTGTLLNDRISSGTPYFLSANHCVSNQTVASTVWTYWFRRSASCGSSAMNPSAQILPSGATLLYANVDSDTSFMRLNGTPPAGAVYAGSSSFAPDLYAGIYGVHHPSGDLQKYSAGTYMGQARCTPAGDDSFYCTPSVAAKARHLRVTWTQGTTEQGSSGSGLFTRMNGKDYLIGQLTAGSASCSNRQAPDYYGRFDVAYNAALYQWLGATSGTTRVPVYRLYNNKTGTHFYTIDPAERDRAVQKWSQFTYEGVGFYAYGASGLASNAVHRFYNNRTGAHFFTISEQEKQDVQRKYPWYAYEGRSWWANVGSSNNATAMYRFYNQETATHFYTISQVERDQVIARYPHYIYEGVGYYAWTYQ